jgi:C2H2 type zinc finger protein
VRPAAIFVLGVAATVFECPECGEAHSTSEAVDQHRFAKHGLPIISDEPATCPDCDRSYRNLNALARHREREHGSFAPSSYGHKYAERSESEYENSYSGSPSYSGIGSEYSYGQASELGWWDWIFVGFGFLWVAVKWLIGIGIVVGIILAATGVFDKKEVPEDPSSPGYSIVHDSSLSDEIDSYKSVEPDEGWDTEYEINDGDVTLRFEGQRMQAEYSRYAEDVVKAIEGVAQSKGYYTSGGP